MAVYDKNGKVIKSAWKDDSVRNEGWNAHDNGEQKSDCPYKKGTKEYEEWVDGWEAAYQEINSSRRTVSEVDKDRARELALFAENTSEIYNGVLTSVLTNLQRKAKKGIYDKNKAVVAWLHVIDEAAKLYDNWYGSGRDSLQLFNKATRMEAARQLMNRLEEDVFQDVEIESSKKRRPKTADERAKDEGADITCSRKRIKSSTFTKRDSSEYNRLFPDEEYKKNLRKKNYDYETFDEKNSTMCIPGPNGENIYLEIRDGYVDGFKEGAEYKSLIPFLYASEELRKYVRKYLKDSDIIVPFGKEDFIQSSKSIKSSFNYYDGFENDVAFFAEQYSDNDDIVEMVAGDIENEHPTESPEEFDSLMRAVHEELKRQGYFKQPWQVNSSHQIKSAVDGGWEVDSSDVPEALDLFVEHYGEETALEEIARTMSTDTLLENVEWVARQWGFGEDLESVEGTWNKYEHAKEVMGVTELFNNLTQAAGYDELAEDLAFIFRQYDFREWDKYDNEEDIYSSKINSSRVIESGMGENGFGYFKIGDYARENNLDPNELLDMVNRYGSHLTLEDEKFIDELDWCKYHINQKYNVSSSKINSSKEDKADEDGPHMKFKTLDEDTKFELREQIEDELEALLDKLNVKFTTDVWEETVQYILSFFEEDNAYNPRTAKQAVHEWYLDTKDDFPEMFDNKKQKVASARYCEWIRSKRLIKSAKKFFK